MTELEGALRGHFENWRGLPPITVEELRPILDASETSGPREDTRMTSRFLVFTNRRSEPPRIVEAWFLVGTTEAMLIELEDPAIAHASDLLAQYGPPEMVLTNRRAREGAVVEEHVYASRGVTFSVAQPRSGGQPAIIHVQLYKAGTTAYYVTQIGSVPPPRPYPRNAK